ncbi:MAG: protein disulfide oxidoreductase [Pseudomonadota bacterium]
MSPRLNGRKALRWLIEAGLVVAVFFAIQAWQQRDVPAGPAPEFMGILADGSPISLTEWRLRHPGRAMGLHFWAEWCPICATEESSISALMADYPVLTVAMQSGPAPQVAAYLAKQGLPWPAVVDADGQISRRYGLKGVPALVVIDPAGQIRSVSTSYTTSIGMRIRLWWAEQD